MWPGLTCQKSLAAPQQCWPPAWLLVAGVSLQWQPLRGQHLVMASEDEV